MPTDRPEGLRYCFNRLLRQNSLATRAAVALINGAAEVGMAPRLVDISAAGKQHCRTNGRWQFFIQSERRLLHTGFWSEPVQNTGRRRR